MEKKTIGAFIAALRKANGMTQKDLAQRLNVSDKTVSRWERDDGAPDLTLIPVIAEVFGVTCDELLRGERRPADLRETQCGSAPSSAKGEKERQYILAAGLSRYRTRTFIAMGVALAGLIAAMIGNLGFLRGYIGFFAGCAFFLASVVCQVIFINSAFLSLSDDSLCPADAGPCKQKVVALAQHSFGLTAFLFGTTLPLILLLDDTYRGLSGTSWLLYGTLFGLAALGAYAVVCWLVNDRFLKQGRFIPDGERGRIFRHNHALKRRAALSLAAALAVTGITACVVTSVWDAAALAPRTEFDDPDDFVAFMEESVPETDYRYDLSTGTVIVDQPLTPGSPVTYYDQYGNIISEEEALRSELRMADGTAEGKLICTFVHRNNSVHTYFAAQGKDGLTITVITRQQYLQGQIAADNLRCAFLLLCCAEAAAALVIYLKKRIK